MTMKHVIEGLMQATKCPNHLALSKRTGMDISIISRIQHGKCHGVNIATLNEAQDKTGVPFDNIFAWYRMPEGAVLGRIT